MARIRPITQVKSGPATVSGSGVAPNIGTGALQAAVASIVGSGARIVSSSGVLVVQSATVAGEDALWDLWGARSAPSQFSSLAWPTAPTITSSSSESSLSALNSAAAVNGRQVALDPGSYSGSVSISGDDVHVILTGCTFTGTLSISGTRVRVTGGRFNHSTIVSISTDDVLLYNVNLQAVSSVVFVANGNSSVEISNGVNRFAMVLCTVYNQYSGRALYQNALGGSTTADLILAGSFLAGVVEAGWGPRINGASRTVCVDNRILVTSPSQTARYHADDESVISGYYAARNQVEEGTWNVDCFSSFGQPGGDIDSVYFYDNNFYRNSTAGQLSFNTGGEGTITTIRVEDNTHYTLAGSGVGTMDIGLGSGLSDYSASNNVRAPYVTPPAFAYGSDQ